MVDVGLAYTAVVLNLFSKESQMQTYYPFREPHQKNFTQVILMKKQSPIPLYDNTDTITMIVLDISPTKWFAKTQS